MTVQCKKVMVCDGVDLTEEEYKAFEIVEDCLRQLSNTLGKTFGDDTICAPDCGPEYQVSDIHDALEIIKENLFTLPDKLAYQM